MSGDSERKQKTRVGDWIGKKINSELAYLLGRDVIKR